MAFGKGSIVTDPIVKRYIGIGNFKVCGVNLTKEALSDLFGRPVTNDPVINGEAEINGVKYPTVNLNFTLSTEFGPDHTTLFFPLRYTIIKNAVTDSTGSKVKVVDEYGRTAWATKQEFEAKAIPQYSNGAAHITANYRPLYRGEELVESFLKSLLGIPSVEKWEEIDGVRQIVGTIENPADAEARLAEIDKYFDGNTSEIRELLTYQPLNTIKMLLGVRKDDQNRLWQQFFTEYPMRSNTKNYLKCAEELKKFKEGNHKYDDTTFEICELKEFAEAPTDFSTTSSEASAPAPTDNPWFKK